MGDVSINYGNQSYTVSEDFLARFQSDSNSGDILDNSEIESLKQNASQAERQFLEQLQGSNQSHSSITVTHDTSPVNFEFNMEAGTSTAVQPQPSQGDITSGAERVIQAMVAHVSRENTPDHLTDRQLGLIIRQLEDLPVNGDTEIWALEKALELSQYINLNNSNVVELLQEHMDSENTVVATFAENLLATQASESTNPQSELINEKLRELNSLILTRAGNHEDFGELLEDTTFSSMDITRIVRAMESNENITNDDIINFLDSLLEQLGQRNINLDVFKNTVRDGAESANLAFHHVSDRDSEHEFDPFVTPRQERQIAERYQDYMSEMIPVSEGLARQLEAGIEGNIGNTTTIGTQSTNNTENNNNVTVENRRNNNTNTVTNTTDTPPTEEGADPTSTTNTNITNDDQNSNSVTTNSGVTNTDNVTNNNTNEFSIGAEANFNWTRALSEVRIPRRIHLRVEELLDQGNVSQAVEILQGYTGVTLPRVSRNPEQS